MFCWELKGAQFCKLLRPGVPRTYYSPPQGKGAQVEVPQITDRVSHATQVWFKLDHSRWVLPSFPKTRIWSLAKKIAGDIILGYKVMTLGVRYVLLWKKNQLVIFVWVYFWTVCLICVSMPLPTPHCVGYCSFKVNLKIEWYNSSNFSGLLQNCFSYSSSFAFQNKCEDQLVHILKKSC